MVVILANAGIPRHLTLRDSRWSLPSRTLSSRSQRWMRGDLAVHGGTLYNCFLGKREDEVRRKPPG